MADEEGIGPSPFLGDIAHPLDTLTTNDTHVDICYTTTFPSLARLASHAMFRKQLVYQPCQQQCRFVNDDNGTPIKKTNVSSTDDVKDGESNNCTNDNSDSNSSHTTETIWQYLKLDADDNATILTITATKDLQSEKPQPNINTLMTNANGGKDQRVHVSAPYDRGRQYHRRASITKHHPTYTTSPPLSIMAIYKIAITMLFTIIGNALDQYHTIPPNLSHHGSHRHLSTLATYLHTSSSSTPTPVYSHMANTAPRKQTSPHSAQPFHRYHPTPINKATSTMSTATTTTPVNPLEPRLVHALEQIMGQAPDSPIHRALVANAYVTIAEVCAISEDQLKELEAPQTMQEAIDIYNGQAKTKRGGANTSFKLPTGHMNNIKLFVIYLQSCIQDKQRDLSQDDDWNKLTRDEYNEFRMRNPVVHIAPPAQQNAGSSANTSASTLNTASISLALGKRDMKLDPGTFPILKNSEGWNTWNNLTLAYANAMGLNQVFDANLTVPADGTYEKTIFDWQQRQAYPILLDKLKTDVGMSIAAKHSDGDAHSIYKELVRHYESSTAAQLQGDELMAYVTSAKYGDVNFTGGTVQFILHWQRQLHLLDLTQEASQRFAPTARKRLLKNAVSTVDELNSIATTEQIILAGKSQHQHNTTSDYEEYCALLMSAAEAYDKKHDLINTRRSRSRRHIRHQDVTRNQETFSDNDGEYDDTFDLESSVYTINAARRRPPRQRQPGRMPYHTWQQLSEDDRQRWDQFDPTTKALILSQSTAPPSTSTFRPNPYHPFHTWSTLCHRPAPRHHT